MAPGANGSGSEAACTWCHRAPTRAERGRQPLSLCGLCGLCSVLCEKQLSGLTEDSECVFFKGVQGPANFINASIQ